MKNPLTASVIQVLNKINESKLILRINSTEYLDKHFLTKMELLNIINDLRSTQGSAIEEITCLKKCLLFYYQTKCEDTYIESFKKEIIVYDNILNFSPKNRLYVFFNIIEFNYKFRILNDAELKKLFEHYISLSQIEKTFEDHLLFNYYYIVLFYLLKQYTQGRAQCTKFLESFKNQMEKKKTDNQFLVFLELQTNILLWKFNRILKDNELLKLSQKVINTLGDNYKKITAKIVCSLVDCCGYNAKNYDICIKNLENIYSSLKKELFYNISGEVSNHKEVSFYSNKNDTINLFMQILYRLIYCYIMIGDKENSKRIYKKIAKNLEHLQKDEKITENFKVNYVYMVKVCKYIVYNYSYQLEELIKSIEKYTQGKKPTLELIINYFALKQQGQIKKDFMSRLQVLSTFLKNPDNIKKNQSINPSEFIEFIFSIYNFVSHLSNLLISRAINAATNAATKDPAKIDPAKIVKEINERQKIYKEMKACSWLIIDFFDKIFDENTNIKYILGLGYIKDVFMKICYACSLSDFYIYSNALQKFEQHIETIQRLAEKINSQTTFGFLSIIKLKGDYFFKTGKYEEAISTYLDVIKNLKEDSKTKATTYYNLGISYLLINDFEKGKYFLGESEKMFAETTNRIISIGCSLNYQKELELIKNIYLTIGI